MVCKLLVSRAGIQESLVVGLFLMSVCYKLPTGELPQNIAWFTGLKSYFSQRFGEQNEEILDGDCCLCVSHDDFNGLRWVFWH